MQVENSFIQIPGVGEQTEQTLWAAGITSWRRPIPDDLLGPAKREAIASFATEAEPRLTRGDCPYFAAKLPSGARWRLGETFRHQTVALDIETTGLSPERSVVTTVTVADRETTRTFVRGDTLSAERLQTALAEAELLLTYNGSQFDLPFLETRLGLEISVPHLDLMYPCRRIGWTGGLAGVEAALDIERAIQDVDGREAVRLWHRFEAGDEGALERLVRYNQADTEVLHTVLDAVVSELDERVYQPHVADAHG